MPTRATGFALESERPFKLPSGYGSSVVVYRLETVAGDDLNDTAPPTPSLSTHASNQLVAPQTSSAFRLVLIDIPGPLVSASFIVPTQSLGDAGEAHTLEHLVFCGSKFLAPHRGYLDLLANRSLSTGTNAYTSEDHTAYLAVTVGLTGMLNLLPVFLDHVLHPTLRDSQFLTEVHHVDGQGAHQGVVYCEMASRENTEGDLLDHAVRRHLFSDVTTYSRECGGLTPEIIKLDNDTIKRYHGTFYALENVALVICGHQISESSVFAHMQPVLDLALAEPRSDLRLFTSPSPPPPLPPFQSFTHSFPASASSASHGSVAYAWPGPASEDVATNVALDVLIRFMTETAASVLSAAFVEREKPWASGVDGDVRGWVWGGIVIEFSGVPCKKRKIDLSDHNGRNGVHPDGQVGREEVDEIVEGDQLDDAEWEDVDGQRNAEKYDLRGSEDGGSDDDDSSNGSSEDESGPDSSSLDSSSSTSSSSARTSPLPDLFSPGVFHAQLRSTFTSLITSHSLNPSDMKLILRRHRVKLLEALQEDPHDVLTSSIVLDLVRHHMAPSSALADTRAEGGVPVIGTRTSVFEEIDKLENEGTAEFWEDLLRKWFVDAPCVEVFMVPSPELAEKQARDKDRERKELTKKLGAEGLVKLGWEAEAAIEDNKVNLPQDLVASMPPVPDATIAAKIPVSVETVDLTGRGIVDCCPFGVAQVVRTETAFATCKLALNSAHLPDHLRPYLVLFQELLFASPLTVSAADALLGQKEITLSTSETGGVIVGWADVATHSSHVLASHAASVGLGNDIFHTSWLSELFILEGSCLPEDFTSACAWLVRVLMCSSWTEERVLAVARNLDGDCVDTERDASGMVVAVGTRIMCYGDSGNSNGKDNGLSVPRRRARTVGNLNDAAISIFAQKKFLRNVVKRIENGEGTEVLDSLERVKRCLVTAAASSDGITLDRTAGFIQISVPANFTTSSGKDCLDSFLTTWEAEYKNWKAIRSEMSDDALSKHLLRTLHQSPQGFEPPLSPFPFPRTTFDASIVSQKLTKSVAVPLKGVTACFLSQVVPCDLLEIPFHPDHYPEGPLYTAVRGAGHAYGASVSSYLWTGQLGIDIHDSQEPRKALLSFYNILEQLQTDEGWNNLCSDFDIETAKASVAYRLVAARSTADGVVSCALRAALRGHGTLEEEEKFQRTLYSVTSHDLRRVFKKYFTQFLDPKLRVTILTCPPEPLTSEIVSQFLKYPSEAEIQSAWPYLKAHSNSESSTFKKVAAKIAGSKRKRQKVIVKNSRTTDRAKNDGGRVPYAINFRSLKVKDLEIIFD
ncbi:hypothetical protein HDU93_001971 [Gonapodya sp. JEL0774]|nr:hypothetical protein HDU93_001971 [Gonapodya sp. JEL0774]